MLKEIKNSILRLMAIMVYPVYKKQLQKMLDAHRADQINQVKAVITEAQELGMDIYVEENPLLRVPLVIYTGYTDQSEGEGNPFKLVVEDEED